MSEAGIVRMGQLTVGYVIRLDRLGRFDWVLENGTESDEFFETEREAVEDVLGHFG